MAQRGASIPRPTRGQSPTVADVPTAEVEKWVSQWAHVLAKGASRSMTTRYISALNSIPDLDTNIQSCRFDRYAHS